MDNIEILLVGCAEERNQVRLSQGGGSVGLAGILRAHDRIDARGLIPPIKIDIHRSLMIYSRVFQFLVALEKMVLN